MSEVDELKLVVRTHTILLKQLLLQAREHEPLELSAEEGYHFLHDLLGNLPPDVRQRHFHELDAVFPKPERR